MSLQKNSRHFKYGLYQIIKIWKKLKSRWKKYTMPWSQTYIKTRRSTHVKLNTRKKMTKREIERIADIIFKKMINLSSENSLIGLDGFEVSRALNDSITNGEFYITDEEMYIGELARLETLRMLYQEKEDFEKCNVVKYKIDLIKDRLDIEIKKGK